MVFQKPTKEAMTDRKLVYVEWIDSRGVSASWEHMEVLAEHGPCPVKSAGWLLRDEENFIQVVPHIGTDPDQGCGDMTIPRSQIRRIVELKIPRDAAKSAEAKVLRDSSRSKKSMSEAGLSITQRRES